MGTTNFLLEQVYRQIFNSNGGLETYGSTSSSGIAYDLISEGEIELVGGLSGVYLNRTPIVNESVSSIVESKEVPVIITSQEITTYLTTLPEGVSLPIIVIDGFKEGTVTGFTSTTVTASGFFTNNMLGQGNGTLIPKLRIKTAGIGGQDYEGVIVSITGTDGSPSRTATISPPITGNAQSKRINFDFLTTGVASLNINEEGSSYSSRIELASAIPNTFIALRYVPNELNGRLLFDSLSDNLPGSASDDKNFKYALVNFRSGTLDQLPVNNLPAFTSASLGFTVNQEIKQFVDYFNSAKALRPFWGRYNLTRPSGATPGTETVINSISVAPGAEGEVDELLLTISAPNGLYAANSEGKPRIWGAVFIIEFEYTNGAVTKTETIFGPTDAEINAASILIAADSGTFRQYGQAPSGTIRAASKSAIDFDFRWPLEQYKPFTSFRVKIRKVTPDNLTYNNDQIVASTTVKALQAFINDKLSYPHSAYAAVAFDSLEFAGNFPERAYRCRGVRMDLPTNYITREESDDGIAKYNRDSAGLVTNSYQIWNGTFRRGYSNNPIWNLREMLLNKRWGLGHWIDPSLINNYSFYSLARYCDERVPDGNGGLEPRFTCGVYLTEPVEAYKIIRDFCTMVLSIPYWVDGQMIIEADRPAEPVYSFTKGNIEGGIFSYEGTGNKTRPNQIAVRFNNKDNFFEQDLELVDDVEDMVKQNRIFTEEVVAFGATTRGQATRYGKWKLLTSKLQKEIVSFKTGENGAYLKPGSIVNVQDADRNSVRYSGRLVSATNNTAVLDSGVSNIILGPDGLGRISEYTLHVFIPGSAVYLVQDSATLSINGSSVTYTRGDLLPAIIAGITVDTEKEASEIKDTAGNAVDVQFVEDAHIESQIINSVSVVNGVTTIAVSDTFTSVPAAETVWAITQKIQGLLVAGSAKQYKILSIGEESPGLYNITAAEHFNSKFDLIDEEFLATPPRTLSRNDVLSDSRYDELPVISDFSAKIVSYEETNDNQFGSQLLGIELNWVGPRTFVNNTSSLDPRVDGYVLEITDPRGNLTFTYPLRADTRYSLPNALEGRYDFTLRARSSQGPSSVPSRVSLVVSAPVRNSNVIATLPRGGTFNKPLNIGASAIIAPGSYRFTAESGVSVIYSERAPRVSPGTYWASETGVFIWNGTGWDVVSGALPVALFATLDPITISASGVITGIITGNLSSTLAPIAVSSTSTVSGNITGNLSSTLAPITVSSTSTVSGNITGNLSSTLAPIAVSSTSTVSGATTLMTVTQTGATVTQDGDFDVYTFNASGSLNVTALGSDPTFGNKAEYLVIAGGGGGGSRRGGGGGAGGYRTNRPGNASGGGASAESAMTLSVQNYTVVVGAGGAGGATTDTAATGASGTNSSVFGIVSVGGGGGGRTTPLSGGSGGGGADGATNIISNGTAGQGFPGGVEIGSDTGSNFLLTAGGGGGASEVGLAPGGLEGVRNGGNGVASTITGSSVTRAGGGGGGYFHGTSSTTYSGTPTPGGAGGGGSGGAVFPGGGSGTSGTSNTGSGGGGGGQNGTTATYIGLGGSGGSGIVIIRIKQR